MDSILDQYHGDTAHLFLHAAVADRPAAYDAIKHASFNAKTCDALPSRAFAWESERRYPVHTREDTIASLVYSSKYAGKLPAEVGEKLASAAAAFGIKPDMFRSFRVIEKTAAAPDYALPEEERLPLGTPEQIKIAAEVLERDERLLPYRKRAMAYAKIALAMHHQGLPLTEKLAAYAGLQTCTTSTLRDRIEMRATATKREDLRPAFDKLAASLQILPEVVHNREFLLKLASQLTELDELADLQRCYGRTVFDPMETVFNTRAKLAAPGGLSADQLKAIPAAVWEQVDAPEMAQVVENETPERVKQIYETLPRDIRIVVEAQFGR